MNVLTLAQEIIDGKRLTREDDLSFFLTCDLDDLCKGADQIREARIGDKVDLCSIINGRSVRKTVNTAHNLPIITLIAKSMIFFRKKRSWSCASSMSPKAWIAFPL